MNDLFDAIYESPLVSQNNFFQQGTRFQPVFYVFELFHVLIKHGTTSLFDRPLLNTHLIQRHSLILTIFNIRSTMLAW